MLISCLISMSTVFAFDQDKKTLLIFSADWCAYCKMAERDMYNNHKLSEIVKKYNIIELDYDVDKDVVNGYNIKTIPTFVIMHKGKELNRKIGYAGVDSLYSFLK